MTDRQPTPRDYLVTPSTGRGPGVLVLHSGRGLTPFLQQVCHRLAREGFVAHALDLFDGARPTTVEAARAAKAAVDTARCVERVEDAGEFLRNYDETSRRTVGVVGVGYGAEVACAAAPTVSRFCPALVLYYGYRETDWEPVDAGVQGHFAQLDHELPPSTVADVVRTLEECDVDHDVTVYDGVEPSFFEREETARYDPSAAQAAWGRTVEFLRDRL